MIFPLEAIPVAIVLNGVLLASYDRPYVVRGHIEAPVAPYLARVADSIGYERGFMVVSRGAMSVRIRAQSGEPRDLATHYVEIAPALRALGAHVSYDSRMHVLFVTMPRPRTLETLSPDAATGPRPSPTMLFTPEPIPTPRPVYTGSPHPRRTPIVITPSSP